MKRIDRWKIIRNIRKRYKLRTYTKSQSLNYSNNNALSYIQSFEGIIKRIRNQTSLK